MTRGKYAVRAANRLAEIDEGIIVELRGKLAAAVAERDLAKAEVRRLNEVAESTAQQRGRALAEARVAEAQERLAEERLERDNERRLYCASVVALLAEEGFDLSTATAVRVASVFGLTEEFASSLTAIATSFEGRRDVQRARERLARSADKRTDRARKQAVWLIEQAREGKS